MAQKTKNQYNEKTTTKSISTTGSSKIEIEEKKRLFIFEADSVVARSSYAETIPSISSRYSLPASKLGYSLAAKS